jgi:hypothetical protein
MPWYLMSVLIVGDTQVKQKAQGLEIKVESEQSKYISVVSDLEERYRVWQSAVG